MGVFLNYGIGGPSTHLSQGRNGEQQSNHEPGPLNRNCLDEQHEQPWPNKPEKDTRATAQKRT
jgi:hypothetical protein